MKATAEFYRFPTSLIIEVDYDNDKATFRIREDTMPTLEMNMTVANARQLVKGLNL